MFLDEIKWQLRMPTRFAMREMKLSYLEQVQLETNKFLNQRIKHDFLRPDRDLTLDLTVQESEILISANQEVRNLADSGELKNIHSRYNDLRTKVQTDYLAVREQLAKTLQVIEGKENELYTKLINDFGLTNVKLQGEGSLFDAFGFSSGDPSFVNLSIVEGAIEQGHAKADQIYNIRGWLHSYMGVRSRIFAIDAELKEQYANLVAKGEDEQPFALDEFRLLAAARDNYESSFSRSPVAEFAKNEYDTFIGQLNEVSSGRGKKLVGDFAEYEKAYNERQRIYHHFTRESTSESMTVFRTDLLQHLAGSIVVKEHRQRYQKEQFDRFVASMQCRSLYKRQQTLKEFCREYANVIEILIDDSHNDRSPKIEANYDDFSERTVRPFNATIFYYFFSADRRKRTVAQWLLSAVRYPNDRVRRAYMRFFA